MTGDHPLWEAIKRLTKAKSKKNKASPKMVRMLEQRVHEEAVKVNDAMGGNAIAKLDELARSGAADRRDGDE